MLYPNSISAQIQVQIQVFFLSFTLYLDVFTFLYISLVFDFDLNRALTDNSTCSTDKVYPVYIFILLFLLL